MCVQTGSSDRMPRGGSQEGSGQESGSYEGLGLGRLRDTGGSHLSEDFILKPPTATAQNLHLETLKLHSRRQLQLMDEWTWDSCVNALRTHIVMHTDSISQCIQESMKWFTQKTGQTAPKVHVRTQSKAMPEGTQSALHNAVRSHAL